MARGDWREIDITIDAVTRQMFGMGSHIFEIGVYRQPSAGVAQSEPDMMLRTWDCNTLERSIAWLRLQNLKGRNIYVRPAGEHNLSLVDDLSADSVERMRRTGFNPAVVVETSPANFQAWLKHESVLSKEMGTAVARVLARQFNGDKGAADWRHFGRLSGFTNRKETRKLENGLFPFVRLIEAGGAVYPRARSFVVQVETEMTRERADREQARAAVRPVVHPVLKGIGAFRSNPIYGGDGTRIDLAYAVYAVARGVDDSAIAANLKTRDLSHKGNEKRQADYVERTVRKAHALVERSPSR